MEQNQKKRLGEILIEKGYINESQLDTALKKAHQTGNKLGASLIMLEYVTEEQILKILSETLKVPFIDISKRVIPVEIQQLLPYEIVKKYRVVPVGFAKRMLVVAMEDPTDYNTIKEIQFKTSNSLRPALASSYQINQLLKFFEQKGYAQKPCNLTQLKHIEEKMQSLAIDELLMELVRINGSDLLITVGAPPSIRVNNKVIRLNLPSVNAETGIKFATGLLTDEQKRELAKNKEIEIAYMKDEIGRFRIVIYRQRGSLSLCARNLKTDIDSLDSLGLPPELKKLASKRQGLILVSGPAGQGKTTTAAAFIDLINETRAVNIITLENPIEYLLKHKMGNVNQREIGEDTDSFETGLRHIYKQNPDVIMIGEMRDPESISAAVQAASTGHLVVGTLNALDCPSTIDIILNNFPGYQQNIVKQQLAESLLCVIAQRLLPNKAGTGRVLAYEIMYNSSRISNLIREGKTHHIKAQATTGKGSDLESIDYSISMLYKRGMISYEEAINYADNEKVLSDLAKLK